MAAAKLTREDQQKRSTDALTTKSSLQIPHSTATITIAGGDEGRDGRRDKRGDLEDHM